MGKEIEKIKHFIEIVGYVIIIFGIVNFGSFIIDLSFSAEITLMSLWFLTSGTLLVLAGIFIYSLSITLADSKPRRRR
jgi:hypothetical protein